MVRACRWSRPCFAIAAFVCLVPAASTAHAQRVAWTTTLGASLRNPMAWHPLASDAVGNVFVVFNVLSGTTSQIVTVKLTPNGAEAWRATFSSVNNAYANTIATDDAGNVIVAASAVPAASPNPGGPGDYLTIKYDAGGHELWRRSANVSPPLNAVPFAIAVDNANNVYVTGGSNYVPGFNNLGDFFTLKYAPDGAELWRAVTDGGSNLADIAHAIALDGAGNVYIAGASYYPVGVGGAWPAGMIVKYGVGGTFQWRGGFDGGGGGYGDGVAVAPDGVGNVYLVTTSTTGDLTLAPVPLIQLGKFDSQGNLLWSVDATERDPPLFGGAGRARSLAVDRNGNAYVTGEYWQWLFINTRYTFLTLKYGPTGVEQWRTIDSANLVQAANYAQGLVVNGNDDVIVTSPRSSTTNGPGTTMKLGVAGQAYWHVDQPSVAPVAIVRGLANSVYVAGTSPAGLVVQKLVDDTAPDPAATIPATSRRALLLLALIVIVAAAHFGARRGVGR